MYIYYLVTAFQYFFGPFFLFAPMRCNTIITLVLISHRFRSD